LLRAHAAVAAIAARADGVASAAITPCATEHTVAAVPALAAAGHTIATDPTRAAVARLAARTRRAPAHADAAGDGDITGDRRVDDQCNAGAIATCAAITPSPAYAGVAAIAAGSARGARGAVATFTATATIAAITTILAGCAVGAREGVVASNRSADRVGNICAVGAIRTIGSSRAGAAIAGILADAVGAIAAIFTITAVKRGRDRRRAGIAAGGDHARFKIEGSQADGQSRSKNKDDQYRS
jgi:hypothetical protein